MPANSMPTLCKVSACAHLQEEVVDVVDSGRHFFTIRAMEGGAAAQDKLAAQFHEIIEDWDA